ncbi:YitT family protein [Phreatobacter sp.]|uniref:YitT family protein n=1 Tax=Phreatobacter sp. TaxID=1966341 RepID=UPI0025F7F392|nr:YitT family protein [Phreatobacter sp.]
MSETVMRHRPHEDAIALILGTLFVALGVAFYAKASLLTGSTVGIALLISYATPLNFSALFLLVNLPFFVLSLLRLGWAFTAKTLAAVVLVSIFSKLMPLWLEIGHLNPVYAAIVGGGLFGIGLLILFRHGMSLGGVSILAYYLQEKHGIRAGYFQLAVDMLVMLAATAVVSLDLVALSVAGVTVLCVVVGMNHRPGRYAGIS